MINSKIVTDIQRGKNPIIEGERNTKRIKKSKDEPKIKNKSVKLSKIEKILSGKNEIKNRKKENNKNKLKVKFDVAEDDKFTAVPLQIVTLLEFAEIFVGIEFTVIETDPEVIHPLFTPPLASVAVTV